MTAASDRVCRLAATLTAYWAQVQDLCFEQQLRGLAGSPAWGCSLAFLLVRRLLDLLRFGPSTDQKPVMTQDEDYVEVDGLEVIRV